MGYLTFRVRRRQSESRKRKKGGGVFIRYSWGEEGNKNCFRVTQKRVYFSFKIWDGRTDNPWISELRGTSKIILSNSIWHLNFLYKVLSFCLFFSSSAGAVCHLSPPSGAACCVFALALSEGSSLSWAQNFSLQIVLTAVFETGGQVSSVRECPLTNTCL